MDGMKNQKALEVRVFRGVVGFEKKWMKRFFISLFSFT